MQHVSIGGFMKKMYTIIFLIFVTVLSAHAMEKEELLLQFKCPLLEKIFLETSITIPVEEARALVSLTEPKSGWQLFWDIVGRNTNSPIIDNEAIQELKEKTHNAQPIKSV